MAEPVYIVSGLPRSGTSMMMRVLETAGIAPVIDMVRGPDADNPRGYYECEPVRRLAQDASWLSSARGRALKVVSPLLRHLPRTETYRVVFMERDLDETVRSQAAMLKRLGVDDQASDDQVREAMQAHLLEIDSWLQATPYMDVHKARYAQIVEGDRDASENLARWIGPSVDVAALQAVVEPALYRQRSSGRAAAG